MENDRIIHPNWHIITGENPDHVKDILAVLEEQHFKVVKEDPNTWIDHTEHGQSLDRYLGVPVLFDRSELDKAIHEHDERVDIDNLTLLSLTKYVWRHAYIIESPSSDRIANHSLETIKLSQDYDRAGVPRTIIGSGPIVRQAQKVSEQLNYEILENMPYMGE